jgi:CRP-like cAMP-binding protein
MTDRENVDASAAIERIDRRFFDEVDVRAGEVIAVEGAACHQLIVVLDGRLESRSAAGVRDLGSGATFGWTAMERRGPNDATVVALTDARLLVMSHAQFGSATAPPPPRTWFARWALPSSRRSLPRPAILTRA